MTRGCAPAPLRRRQTPQQAATGSVAALFPVPPAVAVFETPAAGSRAGDVGLDPPGDICAGAPMDAGVGDAGLAAAGATAGCAAFAAAVAVATAAWAALAASRRARAGSSTAHGVMHGMDSTVYAAWTAADPPGMPVSLSGAGAMQGLLAVHDNVERTCSLRPVRVGRHRLRLHDAKTSAGQGRSDISLLQARKAVGQVSQPQCVLADPHDAVDVVAGRPGTALHVRAQA